MMETKQFTQVWLNYSDKNNHFESILVAVKNITPFFYMISELLESDKIDLLLLSDGNQINDNKNLENLEIATELIVCTKEQMQKLSIYFYLKRDL